MNIVNRIDEALKEGKKTLPVMSGKEALEYIADANAKQVFRDLADIKKIAERPQVAVTVWDDVIIVTNPDSSTPDLFVQFEVKDTASKAQRFTKVVVGVSATGVKRPQYSDPEATVSFRDIKGGSSNSATIVLKSAQQSQEDAILAAERIMKALPGVSVGDFEVWEVV